MLGLGCTTKFALPTKSAKVFQSERRRMDDLSLCVEMNPPNKLEFSRSVVGLNLVVLHTKLGLGLGWHIIFMRCFIA